MSSTPQGSGAAGANNPHFAAIGGTAAIARLVTSFYDAMDTFPEASGIRALHPRDLAPVKDVLTRYLTEWLGGPAVYSAERGHPRLRRRHLPFRIGAAERDAWMLCMRHALGQVVPDERLRAQLDAAFYKVADFLRNDTDHVHAHHSSSGLVHLDPAPSGSQAPPGTRAD